MINKKVVSNGITHNFHFDSEKSGFLDTSKKQTMNKLTNYELLHKPWPKDKFRFGIEFDASEVPGKTLDEVGYKVSKTVQLFAESCNVFSLGDCQRIICMRFVRWIAMQGIERIEELEMEELRGLYDNFEDQVGIFDREYTSNSHLPTNNPADPQT